MFFFSPLTAAATSDLIATIAVTLDGFAVSVTANDPDASSIGVTLGAIGVDIAASNAVSGSIGVTLGAVTVSLTADIDSTGIVEAFLSPFSLTVDADSAIDGSASLTLASFSVAVSADSGSVEPGDASVAISLGSFEVYAEADTDNDIGEDMTLSELIPAILNPLVENRVWQDATPDDLPRSPTTDSILPFIIWNMMGGQDSEYVDQTMPSYSHARVQVHICAPSGIVIDRLARRAGKALLASTYTVGVLGSPVGTYDAARKLRGRRQLFSIWFRQT